MARGSLCAAFLQLVRWATDRPGVMVQHVCANHLCSSTFGPHMCSIAVAAGSEVPSIVRSRPIGIFREDGRDMGHVTSGASWGFDLAAAEGRAGICRRAVRISQRDYPASSVGIFQSPPREVWIGKCLTPNSLAR